MAYQIILKRPGECNAFPLARNGHFIYLGAIALHLRAVSDELWETANRAIDERAPQCDWKTGRDHPLYGIPRDSREPLSGILRCGVCKEKMNVPERDKYRCRDAKGRRGISCWNKATAPRHYSHELLSRAIVRQLEVLEANVGGYLDRIAQVLGNDEQRSARRKELLDRERDCTERIENLTLTAEYCQSPEQAEPLAAKIGAVTEELAQVRAELERLDREAPVLPDADEVLQEIREVKERVARMDRDARGDVQALVGEVRAVPHQQFDSNKVVLRARFTVDPVGILPFALRSALKRLYGDELPEDLRPVPLTVDLFEPSTGPKHGVEAERLEREEGLGLTAIGRRLGINKRRAHLAVQFGRKLRAAGRTDPLIELTDKPKNASRWRDRRRPSEEDSDAT